MQTFTQFFESKNKVKSKKYDFSSILYLLPDKISNLIYKWGIKEVSDDDLYRDPDDPSFGREDEIHCTVIYGIHDKRSLSVRQVLKEVKPFEIKLGKISSFTAPEKFDVLKVDVSGVELHRLHDLIRGKIQVTESFPEYKPHVTIAYLKKGKAEQYVGSEVFKNVSMRVNKVVFSSSAGLKTPIRLKDEK
jgi:hypothetical protein